MTRTRRLEIVTGTIFVIAGLPKFIAFDWELDAFRRFGLPLPEAWVIAAGLIEIIGGLLLLQGRHVRPVAALLAITMAVAVYSSGILEGDIIPSLTLAPALGLASIYLTARAST
jgi:putative oxidoreductase